MPSSSLAITSARLPRVDLYRLLADSGRLQILALCAEEELSVGELGSLLNESQPQVSRRVAPLRQGGLLEARRDGTRTWLSATSRIGTVDPVVGDAIEEGRRLCSKDGSLARVPTVVAAREEVGRALFEAGQEEHRSGSAELSSPGNAAHLAALAPLLPGRSLAVDVGTGEGILLDVLAPLFARVIAVDRSPARLARCASRVAARGFNHVSLFPGNYDDAALVERVDAAGGADLVFASRTLHHASRPAQAVQSFARLLKKGGHLVVLDYLPHDDDRMREEQGDVWLGFPRKELAAQMIAAGFEILGEVEIPAAFHREGPDAHLEWFAVAARRPAGPALQLTPRLQPEPFHQE